MAKKRLFNEDIAYSQILKMADDTKNFLEKERDEAITESPEDSENISSEFKNKLQSVYRIRNNAFALMLRQGYECHSRILEEDGQKNIYLRLDDTDRSYDVEVSVLKNVLFKDFDDIIKNVFSEENSETTLQEVLDFKKEQQKPKKQKGNKVPEINVVKVSETNVIDNKKYDEETVDDMLVMMNDVPQEKPMYPIPEKTNSLTKIDMMPVFDDEEAQVEIENEEENAPTEESLEEIGEFYKDLLAENNIYDSNSEKEEPVEKQDDKSINKEQEKSQENQTISDDEFEIVDTSEFEIVDTSNEEFEIIDDSVSNSENQNEEVTEDVSESEQKVDDTQIIEEDKIETADNSQEEIISDDEFEIVDTNFEEEFEIVDSSKNNENTIEDNFKNDEFEITDLNESNEIENKEETVEQKEEKIIKITKPSKEKNGVCPHCHAQIGANDTICSSCGFDLVNNKITESELEDMDEEEQFDENDIKRILDEIRADYMKAKREEEEREEKERKEQEKNKETKIDLTSAPKRYLRDNFRDVKMYRPKDSDPIKKKAELICDIYHIKAMDKPELDKDGNPIEGVDRPVRDILVILYPLSIPKNGNEVVSQVAAYVVEDDFCKEYYSDYKRPSSIKCETPHHTFLFRWSWKEGQPVSRFMPNGIENDNILEARVKTIRPECDMSLVGYGHPYIIMSVNLISGEESLHIHALNIPDIKFEEDGSITVLSETIKDNDGNVKCLYILDTPSTEGNEIDQSDQRQSLLPQNNVPNTADFGISETAVHYDNIFRFLDKFYHIYCVDNGDSIETILEEKQK